MNVIKMNIFLFLSINLISCNAQTQCSITMGEFYASLKKIKGDTASAINYKKYSSFDFKSFSVIDEKINSKNYFEIGYDSKNLVREIIHHDTAWNTTKFIVYYFDGYKIMLMKYKSHNDSFDYTPVAFFISDNLRFMITLSPLTGSDQYQFGMMFKYSPISSIEEVSCIMFLNEELYPTEYYIAHNGYIQVRTVINYYGTSHRLKNERVQVLLSPEKRQGCKLESSLCLNEISYRLFGRFDMAMTTQPMHYKEDYPLWIYCGASWYK